MPTKKGRGAPGHEQPHPRVLLCSVARCIEPRSTNGLCRGHAEQAARGERFHDIGTRQRSRRGSRKYRPTTMEDGTIRRALIGSDKPMLSSPESEPILSCCKRFMAVHSSWTTYARCVRGTNEVAGRYAHHLVLDPKPEGEVTADHLNGNGLDNRVDNLRWATASEQATNRHRPQRRTRTSKYSGVRRREDRWEARFRDREGRRWWLGIFDSEEAAAIAVDRAALAEYGTDYKGFNLLGKKPHRG